MLLYMSYTDGMRLRMQYSVSSRLRLQPSMSVIDKDNDLIIGLNKYSHDASCCIVNASSGKILFSQSKERVTGKKHDGGAVHSIGK